MKTTHIAYHFKNGIRFHHTSSTHPQDGQLEKDDKDFFTALESHYMCEIFLLLSGSVNYVIEGINYKISPMEMVIIPPHKPHSLKADAYQKYERMVLHFDTQFLPSFNDLELLRPFRDAKAFAHIIPKSIVEKYDLFGHMNNFKQICHAKDTDKYIDLNLVMAIIKFTKVMNEMIEDTATLNDIAAKTSAIGHSISSLCIQYINEHLKENLTTVKISKALNISTTHLQHTFKKETGSTIHYYIFRQKMQYAHLLLSQGQPAQSVASTLGYECYSTFYLNYVKYFNVPPSAPINKKFYGDEYPNTPTNP